jgi:Raf kinase inhibitor-like YbhB/YbcL family protein
VRAAALVLVSLLLLAGCGGGGGEDDGEIAATSAPGFQFVDGELVDGEPIDPRYTCDGDDVSPALRWQGIPEGTKQLALVFEDPDADGFTHWLAYAMPPATAQLPQAIPNATDIPGPTPLYQGRNSFGDVGYEGPCPPEGETHTYVLRLLALDRDLGLPAGLDRAGFESASQGHVIAEARLEAPYTRGS